MSTTEWIIVVVVVLIFGVGIGRRSAAAGNPTRSHRPSPPRRFDRDGIDSATLTVVRSELRAGRKIDAIRLYRQATGVGLKDAKDAVEELAAREGLG